MIYYKFILFTLILGDSS
uniref:Uncharacterized protein n=1 Tax=Arundo donax TaxID=35708 RepID=A0A0A9A029_ARUDO